MTNRPNLIAWRASGFTVEIEASGNIVLRQARITMPDVVLTVTNVQGLIEALHNALVYRDLEGIG